jgi:hypothetical protein
MQACSGQSNFRGRRKAKDGRRKPIGNNFLDHVRIVTREQDDPIGAAVRPSNLLLSSGQTRFWRIGQQEVGTCQSGFRRQLGEYLDEHTVLRSFSRPACGESLMVASDVAMPPPKLAATRHWLRTMLR